MSNERFTTENMEGYSQEALDQLNSMYVQRMHYEEHWVVIKVIRDFTKKGLPTLGKVYNIGFKERGRHTINFHDGKSVHKDGSPFFDLLIHSNERAHKKAIKDLEAQGYTRQQYVV